MNRKYNAIDLKGHYLRVLVICCVFFSMNSRAGLFLDSFGEIENEFWVTWNEESYECSLSLDTQQNLTLTVIKIGQASPAQHYILHNNLIGSLALNLAKDKERSKKYAKYIIALIAVTVVLPGYPNSPNLTLPADVTVSQNEVCLQVCLSAHESDGNSVFSIIDITETPSTGCFNVTVNGLNESGFSQSLQVQFQDGWVVTPEADKEADKEVELTWFRNYQAETKKRFWGFGSK